MPIPKKLIIIGELIGISLYIRRYIAIAFLTLLSACGGGGDESSNPPAPPPVTASTGIFVDGAVAGLHYETPTFSGTTNSAGEYDFLPGEIVTFSIGGIVLGSAVASPVVTPLTLVSGAADPTNPVVTNIVRFLLTLDEDGNPDNGISISSATTTAAAGLSIDFTTPDLTTDAGVTTLLAALPGTPTLVDTTVAQTHFREILATTWGIMNWGSGTWKVAPTP